MLYKKIAVTYVSCKNNDFKLRQPKLYDKLLIYAIISPLGISRPRIATSGIAINGYTYTDNFLAKKLLPYIRKHSIYILARPYGSSLLEQRRLILKWPKYQIWTQIDPNLVVSRIFGV